jgi:hypothetical protein
MQRYVKNLKASLTTAAAALMLGACALPFDEQEIEAVYDYIAANDLQEVDKLRYYRQLHYRYINNFFVTVDTRTGNYLVEFKRECRALKQLEFTPEMVDKRDGSDTLRARFDTIRGCYIDKIYTITEAQSDAISDLGDAPGDEVFLPEADSE